MAKRRNKSVNEERKKRVKIDRIKLKNYSISLTQCFFTNVYGFEAYFYTIKQCSLFGVLLPIKYPNNMELDFLCIISANYEKFEQIRKFQNILWRDLFKASVTSKGPISEANYLVVPITLRNAHKVIDFEIIEKSLKEPKEKLVDISLNLRTDLIVIQQSGAKWRYIGQVTSDKTDFFTRLYGENYSKITQISENYKNFSTTDLLLYEEINCESLVQFRKLLKEPIIYSDVIFAKHTRSIKHTCTSQSNFFPKGTPLLLSNELSIFYLTGSHWAQGNALLKSLMDLELFSYVWDFAEKIKYHGNLCYLQQAMTSSAVDSKCNYEPLETIGDSIIKFLTSLDLYLDSLSPNENKMTQNRGFLVSNKNLAEVSKNLEFQYFIKTAVVPINFFRPSYYCNKAFTEETLESEQLITDSVLADFFEAVVGSFYMGGGLLDAAKFLKGVGIIRTKNWKAVKWYLSNEDFKVASSRDFDAKLFGKMKICDLYPTFKENDLEKHINLLISYTFTNKELLQQAFISKTLNSNNYESLEFLGDSILDLVILLNIYECGNFTSNELSQLKQLLVCNQNLSCISIATGLKNYLKPQIKSEFNSDEIDIIRDKIFFLDFPKPFGDIFEALIGAVLLDSQNLASTLKIFGRLMKKQIIYALKNMRVYLEIQKSKGIILKSSNRPQGRFCKI